MPQVIEAKPIEILLVEDNPGDVDLTKAALRRSKLATHLSVARDGEQALAMLRRDGQHSESPWPDMILLDLNLPKKSGKEVLAEIKQDPELRRIPVAVVTSSQAEQDIIRSYDLHANCYVTKPLDLSQFRRVVETIEDFWFMVVKLPSRSRSTAVVAAPSD